MRIAATTLLLAFAAPLAACGAGLADTKPAAQSEAGLDIIPLTISSGGRTHRFKVEVARTDAQQTRGLMYRDRLAPDRGMIFPYAAPRPLSFWMKNTPHSLDLIFIAADRTIESISADAVPLSLEQISSQGPVIAVLEVAGGRAAELGLRPGDQVRWGE